MAYGNNRAGKQTRSNFRQAGGDNIIFKHPLLAGQISSTNASIDEVNMSASVKLDGIYFSADQAQENAKQVVLIDGSVVTVTNKLLNGVATVPAIPTTGYVRDGDLIACCQLIRSLGDDVGGLIIHQKRISGKVIVRVYYGVTVAACPDAREAGNDVAEYPIKFLYAGWIEADGGNLATAKRKVWAVGNAKGIEGFYTGYNIQNNNGETGTGESPLPTMSIGGKAVQDTLTDNPTVSTVDNKKVKVNNLPSTGYPQISDAEEYENKTTGDSSPLNEPKAKPKTT